MEQPKHKPYVEVYKRADNLYDWRMKAGNGEIVATSGGQGYTERNDAVEAWLRFTDAYDWLNLEIRYA